MKMGTLSNQNRTGGVAGGLLFGMLVIAGIIFMIISKGPMPKAPVGGGVKSETSFSFSNLFPASPPKMPKAKHMTAKVKKKHQQQERKSEEIKASAVVVKLKESGYSPGHRVTVEAARDGFDVYSNNPSSYDKSLR